MGATLRVAMIGAGSLARAVHYPALASFPDVELAAICELDKARLDSAAEAYGVSERWHSTHFDGYREMLAAVKPDAVFAVGQPNIMYPIWRHCLEQGLNLFIEKPMGLSLHQAESLAWLAERSGSITQVGFQRRRSPMVMHMRSECLKRGPITHAVCEFYKCNPEPMLDARDHMMDDGVHAIDTLRWMCGGEVADVQSICRRIGTPDLNFFAVLMTFDNGATGVMVNSWTSGRRIFRVQMHAPGICAEAEHEGKGAIYADGDTQGEWFDAKEMAGNPQLWGYAGFRDKDREFLDCIRSGEQPSSCFSDAVKTMRVAEIILAKHLLNV